MDIDESLSKFFLGEYLLDEQICGILNYRERCIDYALHRNMKMVDVTYGDMFEQALTVSINDSSFFREKIKGKRVIELGPGADPKADWLYENCEISEYIGVEPFYPHLTREKITRNSEKNNVIQEDGLSFLLNQPDESAIVMSNGVICKELIISPYNENVDYFRFLAKEIYRVTPIRCPTFHISAFFHQDFFVKHGFQKPDYINEIKGLHFFEKPQKTK